MFALMMLGAVVVLIVIFVKPKWGTFLIWPILFTYPQSWWYYHSPFPLNIGVDDLFCIALFLAVLVRRNIIERVPIRFGYAFWAITGFFVVFSVSNIAGSIYSAPGERILYLKDIMKMGVYWGLFYAVLHCIDDARDLKIQFTMFSIAAVAGAVIVILHYYFPAQMIHWANPFIVERVGVKYEHRATGAFLNANGAACVLTCSLIFVVTAMKLQKRFISKMLIYAFVGVLLIGILVTKSRAGLMALVGSFLLMGFFSKTKRIAWMAIIVGFAVMLLFAGVRQAYQERVRQAYDPQTSQFGKNVVARFNVWKSYFETATPLIYILGQGHRQGIVRNVGESHSVYVALITVYGIGGLLWAIVALIIFLKRVLISKHSPDLLLSVVASGCFWALTAWGIYGTSSDAISSQYPRYLLFYFVVLVDRASFIARQEEEIMSAYDEEAWQLAEHPDLVEVY